ncbi:unannotated protein [freshwater metagenome]|uniref:Unannotated protein n=1 Tax=freshwater metagenome TaxID=449393 RepID=A0A6J6YYJ8_9ZZZZ
MHLQEAVLHLLDGDLLGNNLVHRRISLIALDERVDDSVEGCREQKCLMLTRNMAKDPLDLGKEPHIGHAVGFIDHNLSNVVEENLFALDHVDHAARGGDDDLDTLFEFRNLRFHFRSAVNRGNGDIANLAEWREFVAHLRGEFTSRNQNQCERASGLRAFHLFEQRKTKGERLARTSLGFATDVTTSKRIGNGEFLHCEWRHDAA